jgi:hypothetical protein
MNFRFWNDFSHWKSDMHLNSAITGAGSGSLRLGASLLQISLESNAENS